MHDVMRKRILRKLEGLPEAQLYQVLDFVEFLEARHGAGAQPNASGFQRFAERLEDGMRARALAANAMSGTMKVVSTAGRFFDGISGAFQAGVQAAKTGTSSGPTERPRSTPGDAASSGRGAPEPAEQQRALAPAGEPPLEAPEERREA
jgi:hypothetical protein